MDTGIGDAGGDWFWRGIEVTRPLTAIRLTRKLVKQKRILNMTSAVQWRARS